MIDRRTLMTAAAMALLPRPAAQAAERKVLALELAPGTLALRPGQPPTPAWRFTGGDAPRFAQGDAVEVTIANSLPVGALIQFRGLDGGAALEPILARGPIPPGSSATFPLTLVHAGTLICDARLEGEAAALPLPMLPIVVAESKPPQINRDLVLLIEDWRLRQDGGALPPGSDPGGTEPLYTINGQTALTIKADANQRLRLRFINGAQRAVVALQLSGADVIVVAIDGQPSEPFPARDGRLVMAPGTRIDAIVDLVRPCEITLNDGSRQFKIADIAVAVRMERVVALQPPGPLPSNGLPERLDLRSAVRVDLALNGSDWSAPSRLTATTQPAFRAPKDRTVVLALNNSAETTTVFHLHGHQFRLLDRLDDGWKPFWLDTLAVPPKQTMRIAFAATNPGHYLMEMAATAWSSPRLLRSYRVGT